jgi:hypothetical protein
MHSTSRTLVLRLWTVVAWTQANQLSEITSLSLCIQHVPVYPYVYNTVPGMSQSNVAIVRFTTLSEITRGTLLIGNHALPTLFQVTERRAAPAITIRGLGRDGRQR